MLETIVFSVNNLQNEKPLTIEPNTIKTFKFIITANFPTGYYKIIGKNQNSYNYEDDSLIWVKLKFHFIDSSIRQTADIFCTDAQKIE
jgi:hypothetical protein